MDINSSFDLGKKEFILDNDKALVYYCSSLVDSSNLIFILESFIKYKKIELIPYHQIKETSNEDDFKTGILSGFIGIDYRCKYYLIDVRNYPTRSINEPDNEKVVRGSRDGFTENIIENVGLIRRRIKSNNLVNEIFKIGSISKTDVSLTYISDICDNDLVNIIRNKLNEIRTKDLSMTDKALEELLINQKFNPYPLVRYTERPDVVGTHLSKGYICILVDNSPSVILAPSTFFDHIEHAEEHRQTPLVGTFLKLIRLCGMNLSLFLMPIWLLYTLSPNLNTFFLSTNIQGSIPLIFQILIAEIGIEFLRMAAIHTPSSLSTAMGVIAGILVGEIAINIGYFSAEIILYTAISQIGSYVTPSYELSLANKISKIFFIISTYFFKLYGFIISILLWLTFLLTRKSFNKYYMYPIFPFNFKKITEIFIRFPKK